MESILPSGTRVERKSTNGRYGRARRVPNGAKGTVSGNTKFVTLTNGSTVSAIEVIWDEACHVHGGRPSNTWYSLAEHLIPIE